MDDEDKTLFTIQFHLDMAYRKMHTLLYGHAQCSGRAKKIALLASQRRCADSVDRLAAAFGKRLMDCCR